MSLTYRPEIDGLRAIAVTAVILFHGGIVDLPGGFAGVDVFFVISGFLITQILMNDLGRSNFSLLQFYERRVRRIYPALFVVLALTSLLAWALLIPPQLEAYSKSLASVVLFVSNFLFAANSGYFSPALEEAPLLHTWSLAVEEQFYLLFPLLLALLYGRARLVLLPAIGALAALSFGTAIWLGAFEPQANFFFTLSRVWELLVGAAAALWIRKHEHRPNEAGAAFGLTAIVVSFLMHSENTRYPGVATLLPVLGTAAILLWAGSTTRVGRLMASYPFVSVGLISYSAYLWHQPIFALLRVTSFDAPSLATMAGGAALAYVLAYGTWALVEQPFRRPLGRLLPARRKLFAAALAGTLFFLAVASLGVLSEGNRAAWRASNPEKAQRLDLILQARAEHGLPQTPSTGCRFNLVELDNSSVQRIEECARANGGAAVVLGDSHAIDVFSGLLQKSQAPFLLGLTNGGCRPTDHDQGCIYNDFLRLAAQHPSYFGHVAFVQSGSYLLLGPDGREGDRQLFLRASSTARLPDFQVNTAMLDDLASYLKQLSQHVPVSWLASRIEPHLSANRVLAQNCTAHLALRPGQEAAFNRLDAAVAQKAGNIDYLPLSVMDFAAAMDVMTCDDLFWSDGDHWSASGEARFIARIMPNLPPIYR